MSGEAGECNRVRAGPPAPLGATALGIFLYSRRLINP
jgi:hypothetical protein